MAALTLQACGVPLQARYYREAVEAYMEADRSFRQALMIQSQDAEPAEGEPSAEELLEQASLSVEDSIALNPFFPPAHKLAIDLAGISGEEEKIGALFCRALELLPDAAEIRLANAKWLQSQDGTSERALTLIEEGLLRNPANTAFRMNVASLLAQSGGSESVIEFHLIRCHQERYLPDESLRDEILLQTACLCVFLSDQGYSELAKDTLGQIAEKGPSSCIHGLYMSLRAGLGESALMLVTNLLETESPPLPELELSHAGMLILLNRFDEAESELADAGVKKAAADLGQPELIDALHALILLGCGEIFTASERFLEIVEEHPECYIAMEGLLVSSLQCRDRIDHVRFEKAVRKAEPQISDPLARYRFERILRAMPPDPAPWFNIPR